MLIKGINYPEEFLRTQRDARLVVFAGAGVSNPPPSSLPLFRELAARIGENSGVTLQDSDPADRYLGQLAKRGIRVHDLAASILVHENTKSHALHRFLLQLFPSSKDMRLVTTNFDVHFSTALQEVAPEAEIFYAPALPLGDDFAGLVYLHGCAGKDPAKCVLTDEDFGRAYLTQGWASRFLAAMFGHYMVLFVGYSHDDPVMNYLARGLPPANQGRRFAFCADDDDLSKWKFLGIEPLLYKKCDGDNRHEAITVSVRELVAECRRGLLDKAYRIRSIAESSPPLDGEDADYIEFALAESDTARIFFRHARLSAWLPWLDKRGLLKNLFKPTGMLSQLEREFAYWIADNFITGHAQHVLGLIERHGGQIHPELCQGIAHRLHQRKRDSAAPAVFSSWVAVLLSQPHTVLRTDDWAWLLDECSFPEDKTAALMLFDLLTTPRVLLKERWISLTDDQGAPVRFGLNLLRESEFWLSHAWEQLLKPNLQILSLQLEPIVVANLQTADALLRASGAHEGYDLITVYRPSIETHQLQGTFRGIDVLIDAARDLLAHLQLAQPRKASSLVEKWISLGVPILKRIAVHAFAQQPDVTADDKVRWLLQNDLLFRSPVRAEVFRLLRSAYPSATKPVREELLDRVLKGPKDGAKEKLEDRTKQYDIYQLLVWLKRADPLCPLVAERLAAVEERNPEFKQAQSPESPGSGFDIEEILTRRPEDFLSELLAVQPSAPFGKRREDYAKRLPVLVSRKPEWGIGFQQAALSRGLSDSDIWSRIFQGWRDADLKPEEWRLLLCEFETADAPALVFERVAELLADGARRDKNPLPVELMDLAQRVAEGAWDVALATGPPQEQTDRDWLFAAINHPGGKLALFWLERLSAARKLAGDGWTGIPADMKRNLLNMLHGGSAAAALGRVVLASQMHYLFWLDPSFAEAEVLSLFDWQINAKRAEQCWHGFLVWGKWQPSYVKQLLPHFNETVERLGDLPRDPSEALPRHIASLALFALEDPLADGWLQRIIRLLQSDDLRQVAAIIDQFLEEAGTDVAEGIWSRWMAKYWQIRRSGVPRPLETAEMNEMVGWTLSVGKHYPEAVQLVTSKAELVSFGGPIFPNRIDKSALAKTYPDATADLFLFCLQRYKGHFVVDQHVTNIWQDLKQAGVARDKLARIRNELFRLGDDPGEP